MPIRFRCEFCGSRLSVASRKAGARAKCPQCGRQITIPACDDDVNEIAAPKQPSHPPRSPTSQPESRGDAVLLVAPPPVEVKHSAAAAPADATPTPGAAAASNPAEPTVIDLADQPPGKVERADPAVDPFARFLVYDDETELVYEDRDDPLPAAEAMLPFDPSKVTLPRRLLYMQGILLGVVALSSFALGILIGTSASSIAVVNGPIPCVISGRIALKTQRDDTIMEQGAVAMVFPQGARPEAKLEIVGLRPRDPEPLTDHPAVRAIRSMGGDYARTDQNGVFRLHVPDRGEYFLLVISATRRRTDDEIPRTIRAQLGRFFQLEPDLFAGYDYRWQEETVRADRQLNFVF
jgi:phage FluMu protein Com